MQTSQQQPLRKRQSLFDNKIMDGKKLINNRLYVFFGLIIIAVLTIIFISEAQKQ